MRETEREVYKYIDRRVKKSLSVVFSFMGISFKLDAKLQTDLGQNNFVTNEFAV